MAGEEQWWARARCVEGREGIVAALFGGGAARIRQERFFPFTQVDRVPAAPGPCAFVRACGHGGSDRVTWCRACTGDDPKRKTPADAWVQPRHRWILPAFLLLLLYSTSRARTGGGWVNKPRPFCSAASASVETPLPSLTTRGPVLHQNHCGFERISPVLLSIP
jgi:hypothetical protein